MKRKMAGLLAGVLACGLFTGCGFEADMVIREDFSTKMTSRMLFTEEELRTNGGDLFTEEDIQSALAEYQTTERDGEVYYYAQEEQELTQREFEKQFGRLDGQCVALYTNVEGLQVLSEEEEEQMEEFMKLIGSLHYSVEIPFVIASTNADSHTSTHMDFDIDLQGDVNVFYAVKDESLLSGKNLEINGVKNDGYYKKAPVITVLTKDGIVESYQATRNGKAVAFWVTGNVYNQFCPVEDGKYTVGATLISGTKKSVTFTVDGTVPKCNLKNGGSYKSGKKITFSDATSGVKTATLDGKKVKSGKKVTGKGAHKLVITDKAGNKTTVKFNIK